jgi:hypothetical protein
MLSGADVARLSEGAIRIDGSIESVTLLKIASAEQAGRLMQELSRKSEPYSKIISYTSGNKDAEVAIASLAPQTANGKNDYVIPSLLSGGTSIGGVLYHEPPHQVVHGSILQRSVNHLLEMAHLKKPDPYMLCVDKELEGEVRNLSKKERERLKAMLSGMADAEKLYGLKPGTLMTRLDIHRGESNAYVSKEQPMGTHVLMDAVHNKDGALPDLRTVGFHEAIHSFDCQVFEDGESTKTGTLFASINQNPAGARFFSAINESSFRSAGAEAGHSFDHPREFRASLMNAVNAPDFSQRASALDPEVRSLLLQSMQAMRGDLEEVYTNIPIATNPPVLTLLARRERELTAMMAAPQ